MDIKELLGAIPDILKYGISGLAVILLFLNFLLLKRESEKEKSSPTIIKTIKFHMILSVGLVIGFLIFDLVKPLVNSTTQNNSIPKEWKIKGDIELRNDKNEILKSLNSGKPLTNNEIHDILDKNLKIMMSPELPYKASSANIITAKIPENYGREGVTVIFEVDGFHCRSETCRLELNTSNYNPNIKMIFGQDPP